MLAEFSDAVWERLLAVRRGESCWCCGNWTASEQTALRLYGPIARRDLGPVTVAQIGQSLDGRVATVSGDARDISGPDGLAHLHRLRALVDAVVIGVGTALHDNPRLTVRLCQGDNPVRVIIDPRCRLPNDAPVLNDDGTRRVIIQAQQCERPTGVETLHLESHDGILSPTAIVEALHTLDLHHLLIEGGGTTIARFLEAGMLSRLQVSIAPLLIGNGTEGLTFRHPVDRLADAIRPETQPFHLGSDTVFDCALTDTAKSAQRPIHTAR